MQFIRSLYTTLLFMQSTEAAEQSTEASESQPDGVLEEGIMS